MLNNLFILLLIMLKILSLLPIPSLERYLLNVNLNLFFMIEMKFCYEFFVITRTFTKNFVCLNSSISNVCKQLGVSPDCVTRSLPFLVGYYEKV